MREICRKLLCLRLHLIHLHFSQPQKLSVEVSSQTKIVKMFNPRFKGYFLVVVTFMSLIEFLTPTKVVKFKSIACTSSTKSIESYNCSISRLGKHNVTISLNIKFTGKLYDIKVTRKYFHPLTFQAMQLHKFLIRHFCR